MSEFQTEEKPQKGSLKALLFDNVISRHYTWRLLATSSILTLSSANFAFDNQGFSQTQAMKPFLKRFGEYSPSTHKYALSPQFLAFSNSFPLLLLCCGIVIGSTLSSMYGRRVTVMVMSIWGIICTPIIVTSQHRNQILASRCLNSIYVGMEMSVIPIFQSEIVPKQVRGLAVASYQLSFAFGGLIMSGICHRTSTINNDWAWRIPFLCFLFTPTIVATSIFFQPESPRWLVLKGKHDQAREALIAFRRKGTDIEHELQQIIEAVRLEQLRNQETAAIHAKGGSKKSKLATIINEYVACFRSRTNLRRTLIVLAVNFFQQSTGQAIGGLYGPVVVQRLGVFSPFNFALILTGITGFTYLFNITLNDRFGRRPFLLTSAAWQSVSLFVIAGMGTIEKRSETQNKVLLAFLFMFAIGYCVGWGPLSYVVSAETPSQALRDKTSRMGFITAVVTQFVVVFSLPYLLYSPYANLEMRVCFIFAPIAFLAALWVYFCLPECKGLSLESLDLLFEQRISAPRSTAWGNAHKDQPISSTRDGHIVAEGEEGKLSALSDAEKGHPDPNADVPGMVELAMHQKEQH